MIPVRSVPELPDTPRSSSHKKKQLLLTIEWYSLYLNVKNPQDSHDLFIHFLHNCKLLKNFNGDQHMFWQPYAFRHFTIFDPDIKV
jgi:hypothetical protein